MTPTHESKTRILDASLKVFRAKGYTATRIEDICAEAGLTKGSFFHHFRSKEELAVAAAQYWSAITGELFRGASYHRHEDPLDRLLAYIDFRAALVQGQPAEFTCLAGTLVQETFDTCPPIRDACEQSISGHAGEVAKIVAEAKARYVPDAPWSAESLALYTQAVLQGAFILAKARGGPEVAIECITHLRRYLELLFHKPK
ncbi:MAG: TetR/AcrR family transcriptional regulator [candidate division Zixibacteria bacterium]|nr:TetR/AcrR family transcriptional regulator [candidate division Zixibacteria bacterium]